MVARISAAPRWLFFRLAIAVTLVLFLPDVYIWQQGPAGPGGGRADGDALAIALITYNLLVHVAPVRATRRRRTGRGRTPQGDERRRRA